MPKKKILLEYVLRSKSRNMIWNMIGTPAGLAKWFADEVVHTDDTLRFRWGKHEERTARIRRSTEGMVLQLHWDDETDPHAFMELSIEQDELTRDFVLSVIDFADEDEAAELEELWEKQLETLFRVSGI